MSTGSLSKRTSSLAAATDSDQLWDVIVVGGGITGAGSHLEALARGYRSLLIEQCDFAWGTSSRSSKMVHGGLRYLARGQWQLTRESVQQRDTLCRELPGLVERIPFLMPHYAGKFPGPRIFQALLRVYDKFATKRGRGFIDRDELALHAPGIRESRLLGASIFMDALTDDARLVMRLLDRANQLGGTALNYVQAQAVEEQATQIQLSASDTIGAQAMNLRAKCIINAAGVWTDELRRQAGQGASIRPLRGSHLVLPYWRLPVAYTISMLHPQDRRPVFIFPWEGATIVGTTDLDHDQNLQEESRICSSEAEYLLEALQWQFPRADIALDDVISTWSGVRPIVEEASSSGDPSAASREHALWADGRLITITGGKLTTFRPMAESALDRAGTWLEPAADDNEHRSRRQLPTPSLSENTTWLNTWQQQRLQGRYGRHAETVLEAIEAYGREQVLHTSYFWGELAWIASAESVVHLDDLLLRRTRVGLTCFPERLLDDIRLGKLLARELGWQDDRIAQERERYLRIQRRYYGVPEVS